MQKNEARVGVLRRGTVVERGAEKVCGAQDDGRDDEVPVWRWLYNEGCEVKGQRRRKSHLESGHHVGGLNERRSRMIVLSAAERAPEPGPRDARAIRRLAHVLTAPIRERQQSRSSAQISLESSGRLLVDKPRAVNSLHTAKMSSDEIPTEILQDIFHLLCDEPIALHDLNNESHFHEFPWAAGQVCRRWRGAFLSHTLLWTSFALKPSSSHFAEMNRRATLYLERSGQLPLTIDVSMPSSLGTQTFPRKVWGMLLSCLKRWKRANLKLEGEATSQLVLGGLLDCRMSSLESLRMSIPRSLALKYYYNVFQIAPHLTELDLTHPGYVAAWKFPWSQLTKLKLEASWEEFDRDRNNLWEVLFRLENIEELHIITTFCHWKPCFRPPGIIRLPGLRLFEISLVFAMMFSWFTAPLLEHLHIHGWPGCAYDLFHDDQPYKREITSLIQRSSCHIRRLVLDNCRTSEEMCIVMKALASVEELSIIYPRRAFDVIQDVTRCVYLPKMQVLQVRTHFIHESLVEKTVTAISRLLEARGKGLSLPSHEIAPLEKFVIWLAGEFPDEVLEGMHSWPSFAQVYINGSVLERLTPSH